MRKRAATIRTATNSSQPAPVSGHKKSRSAKAEAEALAAAKFWEAYREWQQAADRPAKRRAYIRDVCRRIAAEFKPEKIILFGSYAYGKPTPDSDVDLLVVMPFEGGYFQQAQKITERLNLALPMDLLVHTPDYIQYRLEIGDRFIREILERGKVMYEATHD
ncbi:MAG: nucleotidyltransferase domain-containing protein [Blastocatellia bacterium]